MKKAFIPEKIKIGNFMLKERKLLRLILGIIRLREGVSTGSARLLYLK